MSELVTKSDLQAQIVTFDAKLDNLALRLTIRLGVMLVAAVAALATIVKL